MIPGIVLEMARIALPTLRARVLIRTQRGDGLRCAAGGDGEAAEIPLEGSEGRIARAARQSRPVLAEECRVGPHDDGCEIAVPITYEERGEVLGVLAVSSVPDGVSAQAALSYLEGLATLAGTALLAAMEPDVPGGRSTTDGLTRLFSRDHFLAELEHALSAARGTDRPVSVCVFDVDHFHSYTETHGHVAGDAVLRQIAELLRSHFRQGVDVAARYGGDELVVMFPNTSGPVAHRLAERFRKLVAATRFPYGEGQPLRRLSISGGVATSPQDATCARILMAVALRSLHEAKSTGRDRVLGPAEGGSDVGPPIRAVAGTGR